MGYLVLGGFGAGESGVDTWRSRNVDGTDAGIFDLTLTTWNGWANGTPPAYTVGALLSGDGSTIYIGGGEGPIELGAFLFPDMTPLVAMSNITAPAFVAPTDQYADGGVATDGAWIADQYETTGKKWDLDTGLTGVESAGNLFKFGPHFHIPGTGLYGYTRPDQIFIYDAGTSGAFTQHLSKTLGFTNLKAIFPLGVAGSYKLAAFTSDAPGTTYLIDPDTGAETTNASGPGAVNRPANSQCPASVPDSTGGVLALVNADGNDPVYVDSAGACTTVSRTAAGLPSDAIIRHIVYAADTDQFVVLLSSFADDAVYYWVLDAGNLSTVSVNQEAGVTYLQWPWRAFYVGDATPPSAFWTTFHLSQENI